MKNSLLTACVYGVLASCNWGGDDDSSSPSQRSAPSADKGAQPSEEEVNVSVSSDRTLRSGPQYYAAVAKLLSIPMVEIRGDYNLIKSEFASSSSLTEMHPGMWIAATRLSSKACELHFKETVKPEGKEMYQDYLDDIYDQVFLDPDQKSIARQEIDGLVSQIENDDVRFRTTCSLLAASLVFY